jgi:hypothetical protein
MGVKKEKKVVSSVFGRVYASGKKFPSKRQSVREKKKRLRTSLAERTEFD